MHTPVPGDDGVGIRILKACAQAFPVSLLPCLSVAAAHAQGMEVQRCTDAFIHRGAYRVKRCSPQGAFHAQGAQRTAEKIVLLGIVLHAVNAHHKAPVPLLQPVKNHTVRDGFALNIHIGQKHMASDDGPCPDIGGFKMDGTADLRTGGQHGVIPGYAGCDAAVDHRAPAEGFILRDVMAHQAHDFPCGAEVDETGRGQAEQLHPEGTQRLPYLCAARGQFSAKIALRLFLIKLLQRGVAAQGIQKIRVQRQPYMIVDILLLMPVGNQAVQGRKHRRGKDDRAGVNIHHFLVVDCAIAPQHLHGLLLQAAGHVSVAAAQVYAVILAGIHGLLEGNGCRAGAGIVNLQGGEQQQHVAGEEQHALADAGRHTGHGNHEFVKQRGGTPVGQLVGDRGEQLAQGGILRGALAVPAAVDDQHAQPVKAPVPAGCLTLPNIADHAQRGAAAAYALAVGIADDRHMGMLRQGTLAQLRPEPLRLLLVGSGQDQIIPARKAGHVQRVLKISPGVFIVLGQEKGRHGLLHMHAPLSLSGLRVSPCGRYPGYKPFSSHHPGRYHSGWRWWPG